MNNKFISSIAAVSAILVFFLLVLPAFDKTRMLRGSIKERKAVLNEAAEISLKIKDLNREIESRKTEIEKLDRLLPLEKELPELLVNVESIVSSSGMNLLEINLSEVSGREAVNKINGTMKLDGSFVSFVNLLDLLEKNLRLVEVGVVEIGAQSVEGSRRLNYDLRFEVSNLAEER